MAARPLPDLSALAAFDDRLREIAADAQAVEEGVAAAEAALEAARQRGDARASGRLLGYLGNAHRMLGRTEPAIACFEESLELARTSGDARARTVARLRLGEAHRHGDLLEEAEALLREALRETREDPRLASLADFALQHLGKCLADRGRGDDAVAYLEEALVLRRRKGDAELIASTELALARARRVQGSAVR